MPDPKGKLVTPVGFTAAGVCKALLCDEDGKLVVSGTPQVTTAKCRAYLSSNMLNLVSTVHTKVLLDGESYDPSSAFAGYKFTCKLAGYYLCIGQVTYLSTSVVAYKKYYTLIRLNGAQYGFTIEQASLAGSLMVTYNDVIELAVDDYVELYAMHEAGVNTVDVYGSEQATFLVLHLLSV